MQDAERLVPPTWAMRWQVARMTVVTAFGWIFALPLLATLLHWHRRTATWVQNVLGPVSGVIWGRIGWVGVRRHGFRSEDAFLAGGLAGALAPTLELTLRRLGWPPGAAERDSRSDDRPSPFIEYPLTWLWGFLFGGLLAALGALAARRTKD